MSEHKALTGVEIKDATKGIVEAVFSTFDVIDSDGDVTPATAIEDKAPIRVSAYGHASWGPSRGASFVPLPPVGKGVIHVGETEAVGELQFFLKTDAGRDTFEVVKEMADLQEWSYGYDVVEDSRGEFEGQKVRFLKKLKIHEISPVLLGAGVGTRTLAVKGADSPDVDEGEDTDASGGRGSGLKFQDEADQARASLESFVARSRSLADLRAKEGRTLSVANRERLSTMATSLSQAAVALDELLAESDPNKHRDALLREFVRFERVRATI